MTRKRQATTVIDNRKYNRKQQEYGKQTISLYAHGAKGNRRKLAGSASGLSLGYLQ